MKLAKIEKLAKEVLGTRIKSPESSFPDLYDPFTMPPELLMIHQALEKKAGKLYGLGNYMVKVNFVANSIEKYQKLSARLFLGKNKQNKENRE